MDASLTLLQVPPEGSGSTAVAGADLFNKQEGAELPGEFGAFLDQASATQSLQPADGMAQQVDAEDLALQLQSLPQGGKLLPLLQQALEGGALSGADKQQLVDQIAARLEQAQSATELNQRDDITVAIHQLLINVTNSQTAMVPQGVIPADVGGKLLKSSSATAETTGRALAPLLDKQPAVAEVGNRPLSAETLSNVKNTSLDNALAQIQQQSPESRNSELASLMTAFKRQVENPAKSADTLLRTDSATTIVTTPAAVQSSAPTPSGLPTITLGTPLNQGGWDQALGERIQWMAGQKLQGARIRLNPANLGPMEVRIQVQNEQASIQFTSAHGVVREALEAALPRLREMFDASGVELVDVDVSGQSFAEQQRSAGEGASAAWGGVTGTPGQGTELETVLETPLARVLEGGRLDLFV
ncbi:MAG: hypothetical protein BMS9Abin09_0712 [Gammaproteobacteria bacterium]|nr:MAG: hypothetical protein BMS9Abin09_0712 [Gammaproteobacteria bacterium]